MKCRHSISRLMFAVATVAVMVTVVCTDTRFVGILLVLVLPASMLCTVPPSRWAGSGGQPMLVTLALAASFAIMIFAGLAINLFARFTSGVWAISISVTSLALQAYASSSRGAPSSDPRPPLARPGLLAIAVVSFALLVVTISLAVSVGSARVLARKDSVVSLGVVPAPHGAIIIDVSCLYCTGENVRIIYGTPTGRHVQIAYLRPGSEWARKVSAPRRSSVTATVIDLRTRTVLARAMLRSAGISRSIPSKAEANS